MANKKLLRTINWPALIFASVIATAGGFFVWRSFANPLGEVPASASVAAPGDLNGDGAIDTMDMSRLLSDIQDADTNAQADLNDDGKVDMVDLSVLLAKFGQGKPETSTRTSIAEAPAPAPATTQTPVPIPVTPPVAKPTPAPTPSTARDATPPPAAEIASEAECPNQSDAALPVELQNAAIQCMTAAARRFHGLTASKGHATLERSATSKAADVASCGFSHTACGREAKHYIVSYGYDGGCWAENLARGQKTVREAFVAWMNSASHREAILNPKHTELGVAQTASDHGTVWVQHFGGCR